MRWSQLFIPTLRETPAEAEVVSHQLLLRAGYIRQLAAGLYSYLYLSRRSLLKIERIIREEMDAIGAQEMFLPELHPAEVWRKSGRWDAIGHDMFRLQDRWGRELCLGMTEEEVMTSIAIGELRSYKQLPQIWYQIQAKFRDEPRPKSGLMRVRRFTMKDSYSFDIDAAALDISYKKHHAAYCRIFDRCGLRYIAVEAHSGAMGGSQSHEFAVPSDAGEDIVAICEGCGYAANLEKALSKHRQPTAPDQSADEPAEEFATPGKKTIAEVAEFDGAPETSHIKSLAMAADGKPYLILLRGDHSLNEAKLSSVIAAAEIRPAHPEEIRKWFGADAGSLGPVGLTDITILTDQALRDRGDLIAGANKNDHHLRHVTPGRDFETTFADLRAVAEGDTCVQCDTTLKLTKCIEVGHIFKLGYRYSESMGLRVLDPNGKEVAPIMGSYGIGLERILTASIEQNHDEAGMVLPATIAPFEVVVTPVNLKDDAQREAAEALYQSCRDRGIDVIFDDRKERAGVKFADAELIGIPYRITVGNKISDGIVELVTRSTRQSTDVRLEEAVERLAEVLANSAGADDSSASP
ncbi:MAG: proline--tRNA ligase [Acidobacteria bacterium]|nr:proline--tRNA ligase [Acidobacteriota bacterium]